MVALSIALMACSALSLSLHSALQQTDAGLEAAIAQGLTEQLMDEVLGMRYDPPANPLGSGREYYDDIGDFDGLSTTPPADPYGVALGRDDGAGGERHPRFTPPTGLLDDWQQEVEVYYVEEDDPQTRMSANQSSALRAIEVRIYDVANGRKRLLAELRRVIGSLPESVP